MGEERVGTAESPNPRKRGSRKGRSASQGPSGLPAVDQSPAILSNIPSAIAEEGRVRGFEKLRDLILNFTPETVKLGWDKIVKMVLEVDRHALAAMVLEAKSKTDVTGQEKTEWFQKYLRGEIDLDTYEAHVIETSGAEINSKEEATSGGDETEAEGAA